MGLLALEPVASCLYNAIQFLTSSEAINFLIENQQRIRKALVVSLAHIMGRKALGFDVIPLA